MPQQWCSNCKKSVEVERKERKLGRKTNLVKVTTICTRCRRTLGEKMVLPSKKKVEADEESE